ncbi:unnamed protein product [Chrysoparadoxa australica]
MQRTARVVKLILMGLGARAVCLEALQMHSTTPPPICWTIAGSDSGGGAGIQADIHAMHALGAHPCTVPTALTAQSSITVARVEYSSREQIRATIEALENDLPPKAVKLGMLGSTEVMAEVAHYLREAPEEVPVVCDPVMISTSGSILLDEGAQAALVKEIFPHASLLTPNTAEAEALLGRTLSSRAEVEQGARELLQTGIKAVLMKGGHLELGTDGLEGKGTAAAADYFCQAEPGPSFWLETPRVDSENTHGTGCTLSSAITACLSRGMAMIDAVTVGKAYVTQGIAAAAGIKGQLGQGPGPVIQTTWPDQSDYMPRVQGHNYPPGGVSFPPCHREWGLYPVVESADWVSWLLKCGVKDIQLRIKKGDVAEEVSKAARDCQVAGARLWVNDHWKPAIDAGAYGIHLGQEDLDEADLLAIASSGLRLGISTHSYYELARALAINPSYISLGPVYPTESKTVGFAPQGTAMVSRWRALIPPDMPLLAIGGISLERAPGVVAAGAEGIAVISAITGANDVPAEVEKWSEVFQH